jgi:hypothetical protein
LNMLLSLHTSTICYTAVMDKGHSKELTFSDLRLCLWSLCSLLSVVHVSHLSPLPGCQDHLWTRRDLQKAYLCYTPECAFEFVIKGNFHSKKIDFSVLLPNFDWTLTTLHADNQLLLNFKPHNSIIISPITNTSSLNHVSTNSYQPLLTFTCQSPPSQ